MNGEGIWRDSIVVRPTLLLCIYLKIRRISFSNTNKNPKVIRLYVAVKLKARDNLIT